MWNYKTIFVLKMSNYVPQQPYNVALNTDLGALNFIKSNPILLEILFPKFGVNKLSSLEVILSTVVFHIPSHCP